MRPRNLALLAAALVIFGWQAWHGRAGAPVATGASATTASSTAGDATDRSRADAPRADADGIGTDAARLPAGVAQVLARLHDGGPFPYDRDGVVFGNFEGRLPPQPRGYYHEYTVPTPGEHGRGARRVIAGGQPPREFWYTADHYESFVRLDGDAMGATR